MTLATALTTLGEHRRAPDAALDEARVDRVSAEWPHAAPLFDLLSERGLSMTALATHFGLPRDTVQRQRMRGRLSLKLLKAIVQTFAPEMAHQLAESATLHRLRVRPYDVTPVVLAGAEAFDAAHPDLTFRWGAALGVKPSRLQQSETPEAPEAVPTTIANDAPDAVASAPVVTEAPAPNEEPTYQQAALDAVVIIAARAVAARDQAVAQRETDRVRHEQELAALRQTIEEKDREIAKLTADLAEWMQLAEREPASTANEPVVTADAERAITHAIERVGPALNGERGSLLDELRRLPKAPGRVR